MKHIILPEGKPLTYYLEQEEVAARTCAEPCFFTWVVPPTVICGRNQVIENEVNLDFCRREGIDVVRRKSGGGCVYADEGNIMTSYIEPATDTAPVTFSHYLSLVVRALATLGINAQATDRNDILIQGRKVSGNAFYYTQGAAGRHSIVHGTLLHSTNLERMVNAITPPQWKLDAKGVQSVRQRVVNISELRDISLPDLRQHIIQTLTFND